MPDNDWGDIATPPQGCIPGVKVVTIVPSLSSKVGKSDTFMDGVSWAWANRNEMGECDDVTCRSEIKMWRCMQHCITVVPGHMIIPSTVNSPVHRVPSTCSKNVDHNFSGTVQSEV